MASRELSLFADLDQGRLVQSFLSTLQATLPRFVFGDSIPISFRPLKSNGNNSNPWSEVDLTGKTVRIAIGNPAGAASSGTFALTYGSNTTAPIAYNADGATIQAALNDLASITAAGGVVVTRATSGTFRIVFNSVGTRTAITADSTALYPSTGAEIIVAVEGDASTRAIIVARLENLPAAYAELTTDFPVAASDITEVRTGSSFVGAIVSLNFTVLPYSGFYTLVIGGEQTLGIPWDADSTTLKAALELLSTVGAGKVSVSGDFPLFTLNFDISLGDIGTMTIDMSGLVIPKGRSGVLNTNTAAMIELLNGAAQATAKLEIELYDTGDATTWTVLQTECTVIDDVIGNNSVPLPTSGPAEWLLGTTAPTNGVPATGTLDPTGTNNNILITSLLDGAAGNGFQVLLGEMVTRLITSPFIEYAGGVVYCRYRNMRNVAGTAIDWNYPSHTKTLSANTTFTFSNVFTIGYSLEIYLVQGSYGTTWPSGITWAAGAPPSTGTIRVYLESTSLTTFNGSYTTGVTVPATHTAAECITALNSDPASNALIVATASGTVTGAVANTSVMLLGGSGSTTSTPPYIRTHGGYLYIQEAGVWKRAALTTF